MVEYLRVPTLLYREIDMKTNQLIGIIWSWFCRVSITGNEYVTAINCYCGFVWNSLYSEVTVMYN